MNMSRFWLVTLWIVLPVLAAEDSVVVITGQGKRIQLDGFLPEWNPATVRSWGDSGQVRWDAIRTPGGVAGYVRFASSEVCSSWTFDFQTKDSVRTFTVDAQNESGGEWYQTYPWEGDPRGMVSAEWNLPWSALQEDGRDTVRLRLSAVSACGDTLRPLVLVAAPSPAAPMHVFNTRMMIQLFVIIALLILYLWLRMRARSYRKRRQSLQE